MRRRVAGFGSMRVSHTSHGFAHLALEVNVRKIKECAPVLSSYVLYGCMCYAVRREPPCVGTLPYRPL